jgi:hypothetical protein
MFNLKVISCPPLYLDHPQRFTHPIAVKPRLSDASKQVLVFEAISEVSGANEYASALEYLVRHQKDGPPTT